MYSDTHFHFNKIVQDQGLEAGAEILEQMAASRAFFGMDIGTKAGDIFERAQAVKDALELIEDETTRKKAENMIHFSAGIWPDLESIENRFEVMETLEENIRDFMDGDDMFGSRLVAIGEGGIDHHWNSSDDDDNGRFTHHVIDEEKDLFAMQLTLAKKFNLPFVVHSRDGFKDTLDVIKAIKWNKGIIHCYSYGPSEVKYFLDLGWYISFSGAVTYTKKSQMEDMNSLLNYVPDDRILLETDSPYLAPVPLRGNPNNPTYIKHTYEFISARRNVGIDKLSNMVDKNISTLFGIKLNSK